MAKVLLTTKNSLGRLRNLQRKYHKDWPAAFGANEHLEIWPYAVRGYHQSHQRENIRGKLTLLDKVADYYLRVRPGGGRFFINRDGAFYRAEGGPEVKFIRFQLPKE